MKKYNAEIIIGILYPILSIITWYITVKFDSPLNIKEDATSYTYIILAIDFLIILLLILLFKPIDLKKSFIIPLLSSFIISIFFTFIEKKYKGLEVGLIFTMIYYFIYIYIFFLINIPIILYMKKKRMVLEQSNSEILDDIKMDKK